ncbi:MAG: hypothetical protein V1784_02225 [bacterium]
MSIPDWLPHLIDTNGEWSEVVARLYAIFERDFKRGRPTWEGRPVWWEWRRDPGDPYENGFWHLITRDSEEKKARLFDPSRAQRLCWCAATLAHSDDPAILKWDYREGSRRIRTYLWLQDFDYVVIIEKKTKHDRQTGGWFDIADLITAYYVDGDSERLKLKRKYDKRL